MGKYRSFIGFGLSLWLHLSIAAFFVCIIHQENDSANGFQADVISTHISMEMLAASMINDPEPSPEPEVKPVELPKEEVPDPTIQPEPVKAPEPPKEPEKPKEEPPKQKPKEKPKKKPKQQNKALPKSDVQVNSTALVNQQATTTGAITSNNPNLVGKGYSTDELSAYRSALRREIERHKRYPNRARMMRKQGVVTVVFKINQAGQISDILVAKSSGVEELDNAAISAVNNARPIGSPPAGLGNQLTIPINFTIK